MADDPATAPPCLVLPHDRADGPANMARDEAMMEASARDGLAYLRTYEWDRPTLSLGYFQAIAEADADPRWRGLPVVRRATGGGAILHDREVTFALAVPQGHPLARRSGPLYRSAHDALARIIDGLGASPRRRGAPDGPADPAPRPFLCFLDRDPEDLVLGASKVVGAAQRRRAGAVLQHSSVLLGRSPHAPELPGLADLIGRPVDPGPVALAIRDRLPRLLGFRPEPAPWPPALLARAEALARDVYGSDTWTRRR